MAYFWQYQDTKVAEIDIFVNTLKNSPSFICFRSELFTSKWRQESKAVRDESR